MAGHWSFVVDGPSGREVFAVAGPADRLPERIVEPLRRIADARAGDTRHRRVRPSASRAAAADRRACRRIDGGCAGQPAMAASRRRQTARPARRAPTTWLAVGVVLPVALAGSASLAAIAFGSYGRASTPLPAVSSPRLWTATIRGPEIGPRPDRRFLAPDLTPSRKARSTTASITARDAALHEPAANRWLSPHLQKRANVRQTKRVDGRRVSLP